MDHKLVTTSWTKFLTATLFLVICLFLTWSHVQSQDIQSSIRFSKMWTGGRHLGMYGSQREIRSDAECALICKRSRERELHSKCLAFGYRPFEKMCDLYTGGDIVPNPGLEIYIYEPKDMFNTVSISDRQYSVFLSSRSANFSDARAACRSLGAHLMEFDTVDEYEAVQIVARGFEAYSFIGARDLEVEGGWVTDTDGVPLNSTTSLWVPGEPDGGRNENCAIFSFDHGKLMDSSCQRRRTYLCERPAIRT